MMGKSLHSGIELKKIKIAYDKFRKIPFPEPPIDDNLYDLYSELVEFDAYIAGLISSFINGKKINNCDLYIDEKMMKKLINFETNNKQTKKELSVYLNYTNKLNDLINETLNIIKTHKS